MPPLAPIISVNATAGDKTFSPIERSSETALFSNLAVARLDQRQSLIFDRPAKAKETRRTFRLKYPVVRVIDGVDTVVGERTLIVTEITPTICTDAERQELLDDGVEILSDTNVRKVYQTPEWWY